MSTDLPHEVVERLIAGMDSFTSIWDEVRALLPAVRIENVPFGTPAAQGPVVEVVHRDLDGTVLGQHSVAPGDQLLVYGLEPLGRLHEFKDPEEDPKGERPTKIEGVWMPPPIPKTVTTTHATLVYARLSEETPSGATSWVRVTDLAMRTPLRVHLIVPATFDLEASTSLSEHLLGHNEQQNFLLTQPSDHAARQQVAMYLHPPGTVSLRFGPPMFERPEFG